jgi:GTPase Era involved in 16S rRNA processing
MTAELQQLVRDTIELTGAPSPDVLDQRGPTLSGESLASEGFYLVGLIGGKEVGKSALVNALVGEPITQTTSFGPGTETVIAYAHETQRDELAKLLERHVPGQYRIVTHRFSHLRRQVLLDLPDIDSHWASHVQITRKMLRHMLFPLWVQSVEKYADQQPQQLLMQVAQGNAADNFLFCLNKADQLDRLNGDANVAMEELRGDYARRIGQTLRVDTPRVWMLSANKPRQYDLPALRELLSQQKSDDTVRQSQQLASRQQDLSLATWIDQQDLPGRADRLTRLQQEAEELLSARVGIPLLEKSLPALADDPASRMALTDEVLTSRLGHWPIVNLVQVALTPVLAVVRRNLGATRTASLPDAEALVDAHLQPGGTALATLVRGVFAQLQQTHPQISELYRQRKLWEDMSAENAAVQLRSALTDTVAQQRDTVRQQLAGRRAVLTAPLRWLLTVGAVLWFPFIQPITQTLLNGDLTHTTHDIVVLTVKIFSVNELLANLEFLILYFLLLWIILRWHTQRRVAKLAAKWKDDPTDVGLAAVTIRWMDDLLWPIRQAREQAELLASRAKKLLAG